MTKPKKVLKMSDEEILRRRENGESIQDLYDLVQQLLRSGFDKEFGGKR